MESATTNMLYRRATMEATMTRKRKRTRLVRVHQEIIDSMLKHERQWPSRPLPEFPESMADRLRPGFRAYHASIAASMKRSDDRVADILRQYRAKGYAEIELVAEELDDDDDEKEVSDAIAGGAAMPAKKK